MNFQMFKLVLEKAEEPEIKLPTSIGSSKRQESSRKTSNTALLNTKAFDCVDYNKLWKILKEMGVPGHPTCVLRICMSVKKQQLEPCMEQLIGSRLRKEYDRAVCCHPFFFLIYIWSTS